MNFSQQSLIQARDLVIEVSKSIRPKLLEGFGRAKYTHKDDMSVVTALDTWAEEQYVKKLKKFDPGIGFLGEEFGSQGNQATRWLVDPIDGTEYYTRGMTGCMNMITLIVDNQPSVSVIYDFVSDKLYSAILGSGAELNGRKISVSDRPLERAWIDIEEAVKDLGITRKIRQSERTRTVRIPTLSPLFVAEGLIEGYIVVEGKGELWDYAPRTLLIAEAGGKVANLDFSEYDYTSKNFITSNGVIFNNLKRILSE